MLCTDRTLVKRLGNISYAEPLRCRSWQCPHCRPKRQSRLRHECLRGTPNAMLTLTIRAGRYATPEAAAVALAHAWRRLRRAAIKKYGLTKLPFMAIFEKHQSGQPHLHILLRARWLDQRWLSKWMADEEDSPVVDIRRIKHRRHAAAYVTKYVSKAPERFEGTKRYWRSVDYLVEPAMPDGSTKVQWDEVYVLARNWFFVRDDVHRAGYRWALKDDRLMFWRRGPPPE